MKKVILVIIMCVFLLTGCQKKLTWQDVEDSYKQVEQEVKNNVDQKDIILKEDYQELIDELDSCITNVEFSQKEENQNILRNAYKTSQYIGLLASLFDGNCAQQLIALSLDGKALSKSIYENNKDDFNNLKDKVLSEINEITNWNDEQWRTVEKKAKILWNNVETKFDEIAQEAKDNITEYGEVAENELDTLKHTIIDNYDLVKDGITEDTNQIAQDMYIAAIKLEQYTRRIYGEASDIVWNFAKDTQSFIKECYGKVLDENEEYKDIYTSEIEDAKTWTQSIWNEITTNLKLLDRN